jgi:hypothetical protein
MPYHISRVGMPPHRVFFFRNFVLHFSSQAVNSRRKLLFSLFPRLLCPQAPLQGRRYLPVQPAIRLPDQPPYGNFKTSGATVCVSVSLFYILLLWILLLIVVSVFFSCKKCKMYTTFDTTTSAALNIICIFIGMLTIYEAPFVLDVIST